MTVKQACALAALVLVGMAQAGPPAAAAPKPHATRGGAAKSGPAQPRAPSTPSAQGESVAAVVNDEVVSTFDVRQRSALILASSGIPPTDEAMKQVRSQALRSLVDEHLQVQEAKTKKITVEKSEVDAALANIAKANNASVPQFTEQLASSGVGIATLRAQIQAEIAWRRLINGRYGSRVRISNGEIQDTLGRIRASASKPQYQMSEILLPAETEQEFTDAETAARRLLAEMQAGRANFANVARQFSAAPSAAAGGDLGWLSESELRPEQAAAAASLRPGQVSQPVRTPAGVLIIALRDAKAGVDPKSATRVKLRQISAPATQRSGLDRVRARIRGCDGLDKAVANVTGANIVDLGEMSEADLTDEMRSKVAEAAVGAPTKMIDTVDNASFVIVCARDTAGGLLPSRDEIEDKLYEQELALLSQRYLMDLRRDSTIITR
jgi:peptidyl-prolyl cis-trans isomerase SurA